MPGVLLVTDAFQGLAATAAAASGLPHLRRVVLKHPVNTLSAEQIADLQRRAMPEIVRKITEA